MFMLRSCPRCLGDLYQQSESNGYYVRCLQCGHEIQLSRGLAVQEKVSPALLEQLRVSADASALKAEGRSGRPGRYRLNAGART